MFIGHNQEASLDLTHSKTSTTGHALTHTAKAVPHAAVFKRQPCIKFVNKRAAVV